MKSWQDDRHWRGSCVVLGWLWGDTTGPRAKEKPQKDSRRGKIMFRIEPHTCQRCSEASKRPCVHQDPETPPEAETELCLSISCRGPCQQWTATGQGLWVQQTWVWHKPSWRRSPLTHKRATETYTGLGNRLLEGTNRTLCAPTIKEQWPPQEKDPDLPRSLWESPVEVWASCGPLQGWEHWVQQCPHGIIWRRSPLSSLSPS